MSKPTIEELIKQNIEHNAQYITLANKLQALMVARQALEADYKADYYLSVSLQNKLKENNAEYVSWTVRARKWMRDILNIYDDEFINNEIAFDGPALCSSQDPVLKDANHDSVNQALATFTYISNLLLAYHLATNREMFKSMSHVEVVYKVEQIEGLMTEIGRGLHKDNFDDIIKRVGEYAAEAAVIDTPMYNALLSRPGEDNFLLITLMVRLTASNLVVSRSEWVTIGQFIHAMRPASLGMREYNPDELIVLLKGRVCQKDDVELIPRTHALAMLQQIVANIVNNQPK